ncbi:hypothetical protein AVEN_49395-1 [Araneus ventricosus]|uniref:Uncharacterized protein n=1 Tax=Araneus ventricosus TaxID=182803 RepID=A0A4Y2CRU7_ARAVE|nr:hypothetical protein AVEN_49395-1 [Araneus ventricosus]
MPYPRSYLVQSGKRIYKRNRKHLIPSPDFHPEPEPEDDFDVTRNQHSPADADLGCPPLMSSAQSPRFFFTLKELAHVQKHLLIPMSPEVVGPSDLLKNLTFKLQRKGDVL